MGLNVRKIKLLALILISLAMVLWFNLRFSTPSIPTVASSPPKTIRYFDRTLPQSIAHILLIPANSKFLVTPAISQKVATVEEFAHKHRAVAILNAGFFDPVKYVITLLGSQPTGNKYNVTTNALLNTTNSSTGLSAGINFFPGTTNISPTLGGIYV